MGLGVPAVLGWGVPTVPVPRVGTGPRRAHPGTRRALPALPSQPWLLPEDELGGLGQGKGPLVHIFPSSAASL